MAQAQLRVLGRGVVSGVELIGGHHRGESAWGLPAWHSVDQAPHPRGRVSGGQGLACLEPVIAQCHPRFELDFSSYLINM